MSESKLVHNTVELKVRDGSSMKGYFARPEGNAQCPGIVIFQEAFGVNDHIRDVANRFASLGYLALAPELFHRSGDDCTVAYNDLPKAMGELKKLTTEELEADAEAAFDYLNSLPGLKPGMLSCVGFCMGGRVAFIANSRLPFYRAASFYGGGMVPELLPRAAQLHAPQLLVWGGQDNHIGPEVRRAISDALYAAKRPHVAAEFSEAGHAFFCDQRPSYHAESARQAWALLLEFLK